MMIMLVKPVLPAAFVWLQGFAFVQKKHSAVLRLDCLSSWKSNVMASAYDSIWIQLEFDLDALRLLLRAVLEA